MGRAKLAPKWDQTSILTSKGEFSKRRPPAACQCGDPRRFAKAGTPSGLPSGYPWGPMGTHGAPWGGIIRKIIEKIPPKSVFHQKRLFLRFSFFYDFHLF